jgi:2-polyprenyl-6-methoxyphenol hydroxylase-like FAD-dependent oxidoreductase
LIDKARFPRDKACGDGIGPVVLAILDELGLHDILGAHRRVTQMSMTSPLGSRMSLDATLLHRRSPLGYVIPRLIFDHALFAAALNRGSADMTGWTLETAAFADQRWQLTLSSSETGETRTVKADVLIGADGARSKVRRILTQRFSRDEHSSIAVRLYAKAEAAFPRASSWTPSKRCLRLAMAGSSPQARRSRMSGWASTLPSTRHKNFT